jgi:serine/threonine protein kinase
MDTTICPNPDALADYVLGRVSEADLTGIASHVEACLACQSQLETLDGLSDTVITCLRRAVPDEADPDDSLLKEVLSKIKSITSESGSDTHDYVHEVVLPQQIGQYRLIEKLGQGGMGAVYKGFHTKLKRTIAIKLLPEYRQRSPQAVMRFHREMEAVGRVDHPNIVRAHDAGEADGQFFLVMEFVEGVTLSSLVRDVGPLAVADACDIVRQAAVGLQHAHEHGLVHRDVKPSNLMLTTTGVVKVLDLGLARLQVEACSDGDATASGQIMGSPDYMAPEQGSNPRDADARADVYALGCTLYFFLAGRPPFGDQRHSTFLGKVMAHANEDVAPIDQIRPDLPGSLVAVLNRMLAKIPANRFPTAAEVAESLTPFCAGSDLVGLLTNRGVARPITPTTPGVTDIDLPDSPLKSPAPSATAAAVATRKAWLIGLGLALLAIAALWYGVGPLLRQSADMVRTPDRNPKDTEVAQLPPAQGDDQRQGGPQASAEVAPTGQRQDVASQDAEAVSTYLRRTTLPETVRTAMLTVVRQHPGETRWSGRSGTTLFGIVVKRLPKEQVGQRAIPAMLELTHMWAVHELLTAKSLLDHYAAVELTDATTLRQAVVEAAGKLQVTGKASTVTHQASTEGNLAISYAMADETALAAQLLQPDEIEKVRVAYRDVMHRQARELMQRSNWTDALLLWQHLHKRKLVSQQLYLDAASCFQHLNQVPDMIRVLTEAIDTFGKNATPEFLEKAGDMAIAVETDESQALAEKAYRMASEQLKETISSGHEHPATAEQQR